MDSDGFDPEVGARDVRRVRPYLGQAWPNPAATPQPTSEPSVRPFLLTSGRVVAESDLAIETQVVATASGITRQGTLPFEYGDIVALCTQPLAVAEVASRLGLHIGVVRVLVSDLNNEGDIAVYRPAAGASRDIDILQRVIRGLRAIS